MINPHHTMTLPARWYTVCSDLGLSDPDNKVICSVLDAYSEPHRAYHNRNHLMMMIKRLDELAWTAQKEAYQLHVPFSSSTPYLATFFHDVVYQPLKDDNERLSVDEAVIALTKMGAPQVLIEKISQLITLSIEHNPAETDVLGRWFCDADLYILAASHDEYMAYQKAVRQEYHEVPDDMWQVGRTAVLQKLLAKPIFSLPDQEKEELQAKENMRYELARLNL